MLQATKIFVDLPIRPARGCTNQCFHRKWVAVSISAFTTPRRLVNILNFWKGKADHWWISDQFFCMSEVKFIFSCLVTVFLSFLLLLFLCEFLFFFLVIYPFSHFHQFLIAFRRILCMLRQLVPFVIFLTFIDLKNVHNNLLMENTWDTKLHMPHKLVLTICTNAHNDCFLWGHWSVRACLMQRYTM